MGSTGGRFKQLFKKYGKVALGVHFTVSGVSIAGLYIAIKNNVDVESLLHKVGIGGVPNTSTSTSTSDDHHHLPTPSDDAAEMISDLPPPPPPPENKRNHTAELAASSGGALALAILCNKALFPIRVPITIAVTPPLARFLARRNIIRNSV